MKPLREALHREDHWGRKLHSPTLWIAAIALLGLAVGAVVLPGIKKLRDRPPIVVYTSQDKVYAEELFKLFTAETGIAVRAVYDSEAVKTVGIANRLQAERHHPRCDVFWNNEELRTRRLAAEGVFDDITGWSAFGYRSRRLVINTNLISLAEAPRRFADLTNIVWRDKVALAYPLFGTTATHFMALRSSWRERPWLDWCEALAANNPLIVDGNSVVVRLVGRGEAAVGLTDFDDIAAGQSAGYPIAPLPLAPDALLIPNTVALVKGGPNPAGGRQFISWLKKPETAHRLVAINALEGVDPGRVRESTLSPDWPLILRSLDPATSDLKRVFLR